MKVVIVLGIAFSVAVARGQMSGAKPANLLASPTAAPPASTCVNIEAYGDSPKSPDDSGALREALNVSASDGQCIFFPPGCG
jgi:hypothetical protein